MFSLEVIEAITGGDEFSTLEFIAFVFLPLTVIFHVIPLVRVAHLTIDPGARTYVCWWGFFVRLRTVSGHFENIIGLEVKTLFWWTGSFRHRVHLHSRTAKPIAVEAQPSLKQAQQAAAWLAHDLETTVLNRTPSDSTRPSSPW